MSPICPQSAPNLPVVAKPYQQLGSSAVLPFGALAFICPCEAKPYQQPPTLLSKPCYQPIKLATNPAIRLSTPYLTLLSTNQPCYQPIKPRYQPIKTLLPAYQPCYQPMTLPPNRTNRVLDGRPRHLGNGWAAHVRPLRPPIRPRL